MNTLVTVGWQEKVEKVVLSKHELVVVGEKVVEADLAVDGCPDDGPPVRSLKVALHDLVKLAVTQNHRPQLQTFGPQQVNSFLIFIRESGEFK